ncbi:MULTISPECIES: hypothetical protein [unclassified Burkholderia]|uniref:hypothetical protein n=1 Tax=unclassified Burkholderia TaxID=2613784 RepID=UPI0011CF444E|nr:MULTISPECIES: hypothetical protein [unclassified Burkholderia]
MFIAGRQGTRAESFVTSAGIVKDYVPVPSERKPGFTMLRFGAPAGQSGYFAERRSDPGWRWPK